MLLLVTVSFDEPVASRGGSGLRPIAAVAQDMLGIGVVIGLIRFVQSASGRG
jgi:hypothetical protein